MMNVLAPYLLTITSSPLSFLINYNLAGIYPLVDVVSGGSMDGMIATADTVLAFANEQTKIIPGHGPVSDKAGLRAYRDMCVELRNRIAERKNRGMSLEEVLEEDFEKEAIEAISKASQTLAYKRKYYDVMKDKVVYFPTVARLIMTNILQEEAEKVYYDDGDDFPPEYSKALRTVCREKGHAGDPDEENAENDAYMEKLAEDMDI